MKRRLTALLLAATFALSACAADTSAEDALRRERDEWIARVLELEDELVHLNWDVCTALWDWPYSIDPNWDEAVVRIVEDLEDDFDYWREDYGRIDTGRHEGQKFYDGFCYWGG